jgi:calcium/calmodulin-dependent protein kinase I
MSDLKPENLLYRTPEKDSELILADFGIAKALQSKDQALTSMAGSYGYAAPEILLQTGHSKPADLWSMGYAFFVVFVNIQRIITYTLLCGYSPFRSEDRDELIEETIRAKIVFHERYWRDISEDGIACRDLTDMASKGLYPCPSSSQSSEPAYGRSKPPPESSRTY